MRQIHFTGFRRDRPLYELGRFAHMAENRTLLADPWAASNSTTGNAPFDQRFYLVLSFAVGARNGWFLYVPLPPLPFPLPSFTTASAPLAPNGGGE